MEAAAIEACSPVGSTSAPAGARTAFHSWQRQALLAPVNAFCVTLYNEPRASFEATFRSLLIAARSFHLRDRRRQGFSVICVIADGIGATDPEILKLLAGCGMLVGEPVKMDDADLHFSLHDPQALLREFAAADEAAGTQSLERLRIVICLKRRNRGKLQSHCLFFNTLCREMQPAFCFQIDSGTTLEPDAVLQLVRRIEEHSDLAALAPRVMPDVPSVRDRFLADWQYADFALRKGNLWPFELACGHLSVIPGQACIVRWRALHSGNGEACSTDPVSGYLRGLKSERLFDRVMYLAEDRVIGNEIVLAPANEWRLGYAPQAKAVTDSCRTLKELFRQRRRWNNSALACRLWLLAQWPDILRRRDWSTTRKCAFSISQLTQVLFVLRELLLPSQLVATIAVYFTVFGGSVAHPGWNSSTAFCAALITWILMECLNPTRWAAGKLPWVGIGRRMLILMTAGLFAASLATALPIGASAIVLAPAAALLPMSLVLPSSSWVTLVPAHLFPAPAVSMSVLLSSYAFWNLHDVSWGTKGLTHSAVSSSTCATRLRYWRNGIFAGWLASNAAVIAVALNCRGFLTASLNPVIEICCIVDALTAVVSLGYLLMKRKRATAVAAGLLT